MNTKLKCIQNWPELAQEANWSVTNLAKMCSVSTRTLGRHFLEIHHQTPEAWLKEQRWRLALELVREGASIKAMAGELGYQHASTFSREFKKRFGQSPSGFSKTPMEENKMSNKAMRLSR